MNFADMQNIHSYLRGMTYNLESGVKSGVNAMRECGRLKRDVRETP